jgi:2-oxoisovalerate dehydrogenase E1 component
MRQRVFVEIHWLLALAAAGLPDVPKISAADEAFLLSLPENFSDADAQRIKDIEAVTNHDVKAVEYFLKEKVAGRPDLLKASEFIHFACTSEDINNTSHGLMLRGARDEVLLPQLRKVLSVLTDLAIENAKVPLLGHHTSGVRKEWYRTDEDMAKHLKDEPLPKLHAHLLSIGFTEAELKEINEIEIDRVAQQFKLAVSSPDPDPSTAEDHIYVPSGAAHEVGIRKPEGKEPVVMVDAALHAVDELLAKHPECMFYGQDVGARLGGVFREAATLAVKYGEDRVFNTPIQEAYIVGSTAGMSAVGVKPIVEIQFADYVWSGMNQLVCEITKSCYLTMGKYPVSAVIRIPIGAYGGGGPYHSGSIESTLLTLKGIKIAYPSNAADMKGLMKAAYYDGNPCIMLEHKGLYWSKNPGTDLARCVEPDEDYVLPFGKANTVLAATDDALDIGESCVVVTYGMGVYWALAAAKEFPGQVEVLDLRSLLPLDEDAIMAAVRKHGKCLVLTEEALNNSFAESLAARIMQQCFTSLDAPVATLGSKNVPAVPMNMGLEAEILPNTDKVVAKLKELLFS